jgi:hypothetical protein
MLEPESQIESTPQPKPVRVRRYAYTGILIGFVAGLVEAFFVSAIQVREFSGANFWQRFGVVYGQFGIFGWGFGLIGGLIVAKYVYRSRLRHWQYRKSRGLCVICGYDLRGTASNRCPECGSPACRETTTSRPPR